MLNRIPSAIVILVLAATACSQNSAAPGGATAPTPAASAAPPTERTIARDQARVAILDSADPQAGEFEPQTINITIGTTVIWRHLGSVAHSVSADAGAFDSSPQCQTAAIHCMKPKQKFRYTFREPGEFRYHCKIHGTKRGHGQWGLVIVHGRSD